MIADVPGVVAQVVAVLAVCTVVFWGVVGGALASRTRRRVLPAALVSACLPVVGWLLVLLLPRRTPRGRLPRLGRWLPAQRRPGVPALAPPPLPAGGPATGAGPTSPTTASPSPGAAAAPVSWTWREPPPPLAPPPPLVPPPPLAPQPWEGSILPAAPASEVQRPQGRSPRVSGLARIGVLVLALAASALQLVSLTQPWLHLSAEAALDTSLRPADARLTTVPVLLLAGTTAAAGLAFAARPAGRWVVLGCLGGTAGLAVSALLLTATDAVGGLADGVEGFARTDVTVAGGAGAWAGVLAGLLAAAWSLAALGLLTAGRAGEIDETAGAAGPALDRRVSW